MEALIQARAVSSNVMIALATVSATSYVPFYLFTLLYVWADFQTRPTTHYIVFIITYNFTFGNSCFNPIALYIVSSKFRGHFNRYLLCRRERKTTKDQNRISSATSLSTETVL
ncbi:hypothetical protein Cfor_08479 [Coptotermes formosanus]|uniref:G-protein coupled receptors family 1 profile domain-containing protein n=1 Tax=Coptotermes formosanus TaxID=36987 RepID=A0A6L2PXT8_COPFO|nr:hypothetical protein Cfor_08479 [Coptotermes formosanus]